MRVFRAIRILLLLIFFWVGTITSAAAYELSVFGNSTWSFLYYSQMATAGFFGPYGSGAFVADPSALATDVPAGAMGSVNAWLGGQVGHLVSGADASQSSFSTQFFPMLAVNRAITLNGQYRLGTGLTEAAPGVSNTYGVGQWVVWTLTIQTPVGVMLYGKKPFTAGMGLQFDGAASRSEESLVLTTDYGPLIIGAGIYPWRTETATYYNGSDKSGADQLDLTGWVTYSAGPLKTGFGVRHARFHQGPESRPMQAQKERFPPIDTQSTEGWLYLNYNNGRFFCNAEADFWVRTDRYQATVRGTFYTTPDNVDGSGSLFSPQFVESWRFGLELGMFSGPAKFTFLYSWLPGPDRRHGVFIDRQPAVMNQLNRTAILYDGNRANVSVFRPYSMLLSTAYGAGVNAFSLAGTGYMMDASILAARLDYAIAANLSLYGSLFYANRVSHGYGWGHVRPDTQVETIFIPPAWVTERAPSGGIQYRNQGTFAAPAPSIPDNNLGWEINAGIAWQLLDSWTLNISAAYWQPGKWFSYACIDKGVPNWLTGTVDNLWGTRPDRKIDGIFGLDISASVDF